MVVGDEVEQVFVGRSARGTGLASDLLVEAEQRVAAGGHDSAWLAVVAGNARARRFYEKQGWVDARRPALRGQRRRADLRVAVPEVRQAGGTDGTTVSRTRRRLRP